MKKKLLGIILLFQSFLWGQNRPLIQKGRDGFIVHQSDSISQQDTIKKIVKIYPITDYKIFNLKQDTVRVDTILNVYKYYAFNELLQDDFLQLKLHNYGQAVSNLSFKVNKTDIVPNFIASAKRTDFIIHEKIPFFYTPSPYSDMTYLNGISQGQLLNALFATNISPYLNIAVGYRGLSSLGLYKRSIVESGRFLGSSVYHSKSKKYHLYFYYYTYQKDNEENGGIKAIDQFEKGGDIYKERSRIDVNLMDVENNFKHHRLYIGQELGILKNKFYFINNTLYRTEMYQFKENIPNTILFGTANSISTINDSIYRKEFENFAGIRFRYKTVQIESGLRYIYQFYNTGILKNNAFPNFLKYNDISLDNNMKFKFHKLIVYSKLNIAFTENIAGYYLQAKTKYNFNKKLDVSAEIISASTRPDIKYILYKSTYNKYNWNHLDWNNEYVQQVKLKIYHKNYGEAKLQQNIINNYTYFNVDSLPYQNKSGFKYFAFTYNNDIHFWKLGTAFDLHWQKILSGSKFLSLPSYVFRSSLYFSDYYYHRNLFIQTGFTFKYFDKFYAPAYNPLLADFILQNSQKIGAYPLIDFFFNFKVKQFRFFFKLEHLNALIDYKTPNYYAAPLQPIRDFSIRFGLRWIWFN